jgi:hypothetical protein
MKRFISLFVILLVAGMAYSDSFLFKDGHSDYSIVVGSDASKSERTAASEFQHYVAAISGATLPIVSQPIPAGKHVYICYHDTLAKLANVGRPDDHDESFTYRTIGDDLYIYGGSLLGTMYGVFSFLEHELGVHWYTDEFTKIPRLRQFKLKEVNRTETLAIKYRVDYFYQSVKDKAWLAHNLVNSNHIVSDSQYGKLYALRGVHTFATLIPPSDYFSSHPEFFGLYKGKRSDKTQLCLSNKEMCDELIKNLKKLILEKPGYWCYDVSQNDNNLPCECPECAALVKEYGGQSGAMLWFVNKVAAEIKKTNPDVYISTLAYHYTRQAPTSSIKPADNVIIRLCDIECCQAHPLDQCEENKKFVQDLDNWKRITKNITVWDYTTGFRHYLMPFPNFDVLARNYQYFSRSNVVGVLELGSWNAPWSEFSELKQWLVAKLLWNPRQNTDSLASLFINDYYGNAAPYVRQYYDLCRRQVTDDVHFTVSIEWDTKLYDDRFIIDATKLLKKAVAASRDEETLRRTNRLAAQLLYLQLRWHPARSLVNGTSNKLREIIKADSTIVREHNGDIDKLIHDLSYY